MTYTGERKNQAVIYGKQGIYELYIIKGEQKCQVFTIRL